MAVHLDDRLIGRLAGRQMGVVMRSQLLAAGLTRRKIDRRLEAGRLHAVHRGVYAVGHTALSARGRELAAVLACGPGAVLSHGSAAVLWGLSRDAGGPLHVLSAGSHRRSPAGILLHQTSVLPSNEIRRRHGVPVTSPARTLLDLAATVPHAILERAMGEARAQGVLRKGELGALARTRRPGSAAMRAVLDDAPSMTRSEAERCLLRLLARARLPRPHTNVRLGAYEVDAHWPAQRLVVEVDGYAFHSGRAAFERDRLRDMHLQLAGLRVMRVTWRQLVEEPEALAARLGVALASGRAD